MKLFILFVYISTGDGPAITMQEFSSKETCQAAGESIKSATGGFLKTVKFICAEK